MRRRGHGLRIVDSSSDSSDSSEFKEIVLKIEDLIKKVPPFLINDNTEEINDKFR